MVHMTTDLTENSNILDKAYNPNEIEKEIYQHWEHSGAFAPSGQGPAYCIVIPPPNVTGSLHMGHAFQQTLMDVLTRYHRMRQNNTLWLVGTDHAGIATQMMVEKKLLRENKTKYDLGRKQFTDTVWQWKKTSGNQITKQMRRLGASVDWSRERFTLDEGLSEAVLTVFIQLYEENIIYRGKRLVNWDPVLKTAVSDLEVESEEENGFLWYIRYPFANEKNFVTVATTRPETLLGDVAVAVNPNDPRYVEHIGKMVKLPLTDKVIPIIGEQDVLMDFGTGCVKITPAHDFNDYATGKKHNLPQINIFNLDATTNNHVPNKYQGLDRFVVRKIVIEDLKQLNLLEKEEPYQIKVPRGDRSGAILEPLLTDQWFVKVDSLAKPAIEAVESGKIRFIPENWSKTYYDWMYNIQDWCISRQLWWGHRIPAWYDKNGNIYVEKNEAAVRKKYQLNDNIELTQDNDVLDTWFSSALWPFSTLGWPEQTADLKTFYPTNVLITGFDIIFFWVARMIMFGLKFAKDIPFKEIYIHGLIQDQDGIKMSKTKGNVLDPLDLIDGIELEPLIKKRLEGLNQPKLIEKIEKQTRTQFPNGISNYGTDALRFTFCALATANRHIRFDLTRIEGYKHFCNKIWNATRFVLMNVKDLFLERGTLLKNEHNILSTNASVNNLLIKDSKINMINLWIWSRWQKTLKTVEEQLNAFRFDLASYALYEFTWNEFCDWYLELTKSLLNSNDAETVFLTKQSLLLLLESLLRALHPFMPFITETLWQQVVTKISPVTSQTIKLKTIMLQKYPQYDPHLINETAEDDIEWLKAFILAIRNIRGEMNISPAKVIPVLLQGPEADKKRVSQNQAFLQALARIESPRWLEKHETRPHSATAWIKDLEILVPMKGLIDIDAEITRLQKDLDKITKDYELNEKKLANKNFVSKAPKEVLVATKNLYEELKINKQKIMENIQKLKIECL